MSKKIVNGETMYSFESIVKEALYSSNRSTVYKFINFLISVDIINKRSIKYGDRYHYVYTPSKWFEVIMDGRIYTEPKMYKGEELNGTLYFDKFTSVVLSRLYRKYNITPEKKKVVSDMLYQIIANTALDFIAAPLKEAPVKKSTILIDTVPLTGDQLEWEHTKQELKNASKKHVNDCIESMQRKNNRK